nr:521_t:CDS:2 [Entrophospora candida]
MSGTFKPILPTATPKSSSHSTTFSSQQHNPLPITITSPSDNTFTTSPTFSNAVVSSSLDDSFSYGTVTFPNNSSYETNSHTTNSQADHIKTVETKSAAAPTTNNNKNCNDNNNIGNDNDSSIKKVPPTRRKKKSAPYYEMRDKAMMKYDEDMSFYNSSDQLLLGKSAIDDDNDLFEELGIANIIDDDDKILCYGQGNWKRIDN